MPPMQGVILPDKYGGGGGSARKHTNAKKVEDTEERLVPLARVLGIVEEQTDSLADSETVVGISHHIEAKTILRQLLEEFEQE